MTMHLTPVVAENSLFKAVGDIFHPLFEAVAGVLAFIYGIVPNYAVAIILLTVLIMVLLTPLTIKSTRSMLAMQKLQPELQKLRQKYKGAENREQLNQEMMRLYRENNVSPTGGCLPMFLQMPALIVLYDTIKGLANTIKKGTVFPKGTLLPTGLVSKAGQKCMTKLCAVPRYIPAHSKMYQDLVKTPGVMKSFGLNLAAKPLTHHSNVYDYIPYFAMVLLAVGLQYFQMAQMTRRNKNSQQQIPQQMQTMQRIMPLIFAYIYFLVPAGVVIYMIVSSGIRVLTQDLIFRYGIVAAPGRERKIAPPGKALPAASGASAIPASSSEGPVTKTGAPADEARNGSNGAKPTTDQNRRGSGPPGPAAGRTNPSRTNPSRTNANGRIQRRANGHVDPTPTPKPHPRSKSKRTRKAR
jgi:YidC/Oxa1 family membrane protein insertase